MVTGFHILASVLKLNLVAKKPQNQIVAQRHAIHAVQQHAAQPITPAALQNVATVAHVHYHNGVFG